MRMTGFLQQYLESKFQVAESMPSRTFRPRLAGVFPRPDPTLKRTPPTRSLTLSPGADRQRSVAGEACPSTCNQLQSLLFKDFPLELRQRVYRDVLGGNVCHIWPHGTSLCHDIGQLAPNTRLSCFCGPPILENLQNISELRHLGNRSAATSFLRSCRRIYSEAIEVLYSDNTFEILDAAGFVAFSVSVLPHRFDKICSLRLGQQVTTIIGSCLIKGPCTHGCSPPNTTVWEQCWDLIANMRNLQELFVTLRNDRGIFLTNDEENQILEPLCRVTQPQIWHLSITLADGFTAATFDMLQSPETATLKVF